MWAVPPVCSSLPPLPILSGLMLPAGLLRTPSVPVLMLPAGLLRSPSFSVLCFRRSAPGVRPFDSHASVGFASESVRSVRRVCSGVRLFHSSQPKLRPLHARSRCRPYLFLFLRFKPVRSVRPSSLPVQSARSVRPSPPIWPLISNRRTWAARSVKLCSHAQACGLFPRVYASLAIYLNPLLLYRCAKVVRLLRGGHIQEEAHAEANHPVLGGATHREQGIESCKETSCGPSGERHSRLFSKVR